MGFSAEWLNLREPADRSARDDTLLHRAATAAGLHPVILDLGCGTGATMRALSPHLASGARWRLVDSDPALLQVAGSVAGAHAETFQQDLNNIAALPLDGVTLVTASALLDLVSEAWVTELAKHINVPFYAALSYDGVMRWIPEDPRDAPMTAAFNTHQRTDKGLGPALGPDATERSAAIFAASGYRVTRAQSPWRLGPDMAQLQRDLTGGIAASAQELGEDDAQAWGVARRDISNRSHCLIGHEDILAIPQQVADPSSTAALGLQPSE